MQRFTTFSLDEANQCVWLKQQRIPLQPKAFAVLAYLAGNPRRIVTKEELLDKIRFYLNRPELRQQIRLAGRQRCLNEHTWEKRLKAVFRQMGLQS